MLRASLPGVGMALRESLSLSCAQPCRDIHRGLMQWQSFACLWVQVQGVILSKQPEDLAMTASFLQKEVTLIKV